MARLDADEMRTTMREIADRLYTYLPYLESTELAVLTDHRRQDISDWDRPREAPGLKKQMEVFASGVVETGMGPDGSPSGTEGERKSADSALFEDSEADAIQPSSALSSGDRQRAQPSA